ncbi:hypothetical protein AB0I60_06870 [Actinosynnema sp. NPDC050436]|uniref:hypothetical protein n=1 Tax=Actinosynnema sp. NPDC050436 TaxID=3155659 RepID=UPI0033F02A31
MTTETENPTWGEEPTPQAAPGPGWSGRKIVVAAAIAVGIAAAGGGVIYAASNSEAAQSGMGGPRGYGGPGMMLMGPGPFGDTAHGEFQNGEVTELGDSSITLKSTDGYTQTYKIDDNTTVNGGKGTSGLAKGDTVVLVASNGTATSIIKGNIRSQRGNPNNPNQNNPHQNNSPDQNNPDRNNPGDDQGQPPPR